MRGTSIETCMLVTAQSSSIEIEMGVCFSMYLQLALGEDLDLDLGASRWAD